MSESRRMRSRTVDVCFVVGTRPNYMKTAPVLHALERQAPHMVTQLVHTNQHYDDVMSGQLFGDLGIRAPDVSLGVRSGTHGQQTARVLTAMEQLLSDTKPRLLVVPGDVNSTLASALAAVKLHIPVAHIESGLRSFDDAMPEEHNRRLTDHMSRLLFAHSDSAVENLRREAIAAERIHLVGNTMIDSLLLHLPRALEAAPWKAHSVEPGSYALVTLHRPSLVDEAEVLEATYTALERLADEIPVVFPVHPRTHTRIRALGLKSSSGRLKLIQPQGYLAFLGLESRARFVLTDSGGVQEETTALGVPCFTLRDTTERPVTVAQGTNTLLGKDPEAIGTIIARLGRVATARSVPLWDGHAGERAATIVSRYLQTAS